jgi:hypothetical protein
MVPRSSRKVSAPVRLFFSLVFVIAIAVAFISIPTPGNATQQKPESGS